MMLILYVFTLNFILVCAATVIFEDCGSAYELHRVNILGCGMRLPCFITLGENVPVTMNFYSDFESNKLNQDVIININFISLRTFVTPDPCSTVDCPVKSDSFTSFTSIMTVPTNIAVNQRGFLQWRVYNDKNRLVLCFSVLVQTQSPLQKALLKFRSTPYNNMVSEENGTPIGNERNETNIEKVYSKSLQILVDFNFTNWKNFKRNTLS